MPDAMDGNKHAAVAPAARGADRPTEQLLDTTNAVGTPAAAPALGTPTLARINAGRPLPSDHLALARGLFAEEMLNDWERRFISAYCCFRR